MSERKLTFDEIMTLSSQRSAADASERLSRKQTELVEMQIRVFDKLEKYLDLKLVGK